MRRTFVWAAVAVLVAASGADVGTGLSAQTVNRVAPITSRAVGARAIQPGVGLNKFDLALQYTGTVGQGVSFLNVTRAMARKSIVDAASIGVTYVRFAATGWGPAGFGARGDLDLWRDNPSAYWTRYDGMMHDLKANGVRVVPVMIWNPYQFSAMSGETLTEMITNPNSRSVRLLRSYVADFINRYRAHPALYFYELTNELNLGADIDLAGRCRRGETPFLEPCESVGNFSTDQMIAFTSAFADYVRSLDPSHLISSGFSMPRPSAEHLRQQPDWSPQGGDWWMPDSVQQFRKNLRDIHQGVDIVSVHFYNFDGDNERHGVRGKTNADLLDLVKETADAAGKDLFVGEFGDVDPYVGDDKNGLFTQNILKKIVQLRVPFSAPWVWEFYWPNTYAPDPRYNLEPGYTDLIISKIKEANQGLGNPVPAGQRPDTTPPQVLLTWPLDGGRLSHQQLVHAVASDNNGVVGGVEFRVDGALRGIAMTPPFQFTLDAAAVGPGEHRIVARASDPAGNWSEASVAVGSCTYTLSAVSQSFLAAGDSGSISVTTPWDCAWSAASTVSWVTIGSGRSGTGTGTLSYLVAANTGPLRTGALTVAGQTVAVTQAAALTGTPTGTAATLNLNGDTGRDIFTYNPVTGAWSEELGNGVTFSSRGGSWSPGWLVRAGDFDGDGLTDFFLYSQTSGLWFKAVNNGAGGFNYFTSSWSPGWTPYVVDLNGDRRSDVFLFNVTTGLWFKCLSPGSGTGDFSCVAGAWSPNWEIYPADFNGDGKADLFLFSRLTGQWFRATNDGGSGFAYVTGTWSPNWAIYPGDFDGDGKTDLFVYDPTTGQYFFCTNTGTGFSYSGGTTSAGLTVQVGDFDNDGTADVFLFGEQSGAWAEWTASGRFSGTWSPGWQVYATDFNADGRSDILLYNSATGQWYQCLNTGPGAFSYASGSWSPGLAIVASAARLP